MITFASIYIGSYDISLKIFELTTKRGVRLIDHIRSRLEIGKDSYQKGYIGSEKIEELVTVLKDFRRIMNGYQVESYEAVTGGAFRNSANIMFILEQIHSRTGMKIKVLSNSEHRFISYKSVAFRPEFEQMIQEGAAIVDVGGGSLQITLFQQGKVITTQHLSIGTMRMRDQLSGIRHSSPKYEAQIEEIINKELILFKNMFMEGIQIRHLIFIGDYIMELIRKVHDNYNELTVTGEKFIKTLKKFYRKNIAQIAQELNLTDEQDLLLVSYIVLYRRLTEELVPENVWAPGTSVIEGIAYDYAVSNHLIQPTHDFENDILSAAVHLAKRYSSYSEHVETLVEHSKLIFDCMKKQHGMGDRERLLLQVAATLHDCGKYISFANAPECAYDIIMKSEILGLTHLERELVAYTVRYNTYMLDDYETLAAKLDEESYILIAKLSSIMRVANALDRSHRQKLKQVKAVVKDRKLILTIESESEMILEKELFEAKTVSFEKVFGIQPELREKRSFR